jgi:hypothetical protein
MVACGCLDIPAASSRNGNGIRCRDVNTDIMLEYRYIVGGSLFACLFKMT